MKDQITLRQALAFDSIYHSLSWEERIRIHLYINRHKVELTPNILTLLELITSTDWEAPEMKYGQDRLLYCYDEDTERWMQVEKYAKENKI